VVASRDELATAYAEAEAAFPDDVPVPDEWGGYRVRPQVVEFWQGRPGRMHDRLVYRRSGPDLEAWRTERLAP
jgi:pyridoxamine 5'-phosphate oxidase